MQQTVEVRASQTAVAFFWLNLPEVGADELIVSGENLTNHTEAG